MTTKVESNERVDIIDITERVESSISSKIESGLCTVFVPHTTAGLIVNEAEPRLIEDFKQFFDSFAPRNDGYRHDAIDNNADAHLRAALLGSSVTVPVEDGALSLGTWQSLLFIELDGPRSRRLEITTLSN